MTAILKTILIVSISGIAFCVAGFFLVNAVKSVRIAVNCMNLALYEEAATEWLLAICLSFGFAVGITVGLLLFVLQGGGQ